MTIEKIIKLDGREFIVVRVGDLSAEMTMTEWSRLIANPKITTETQP